jgi:hypothetical protein
VSGCVCVCVSVCECVCAVEKLLPARFLIIHSENTLLGVLAPCRGNDRFTKF